MEEALLKSIDLLEKLKRLNLIKNYALTGGVALSFYVSYRATFDIDFVVDASQKNLLRDIYEWLKNKGYKAKRNWEIPMLTIEIKKTPVELIPAKGALVEGIKDVRLFSYKGATIPVIRPEYLILSKLLRRDEQDMMDVEILKKEVKIDERILQRYKKEIRKV